MEKMPPPLLMVSVKEKEGDDIFEITGFTITGGLKNGIDLTSSALHTFVSNNIILGN